MSKGKTAPAPETANEQLSYFLPVLPKLERRENHKTNVSSAEPILDFILPPGMLSFINRYSNAKLGAFVLLFSSFRGFRNDVTADTVQYCNFFRDRVWVANGHQYTQKISRCAASRTDVINLQVGK